MKSKALGLLLLTTTFSFSLIAQDIVDQSDFDNYLNKYSNNIEQNFNSAMQGLEPLKKNLSDDTHSQEDWDAVYQKAATKFRRGGGTRMAYSQGQTTIVDGITFPDGKLVGRGRFTGAGTIRIEDLKERTQQKEYEESRASTLKIVQEGESKAQQQKKKDLEELQQKLEKIREDWKVQGEKLNDFVTKVKTLQVSQSTKDDVVTLLGQPTTDNQNSLFYSFKPEGLRGVSAGFTFDNLAKLSNVNISKIPKTGSAQVIYSKSLN
jgi:vacuolar-type H+-ATPase subunit H